LAATAIAAAALAVVGALVVTGAFGGLDQYAVDHWMRHIHPGGSSSSFASELYPKLGSPLQAVTNVWTYPAAPVVSSLVVLVCCLVLYRRGRPRAAVVWAAVWMFANAAELVGKSVLERPTLHLGRVPLHTFDNSFPSGHALRACLAAALLLTVWRRAAWPALLWIIMALPGLVVNAAHTPSDVLGGALLAALAVLAVRVSLQLEPRLSSARLRTAVADQP
jgi:membrane-associated phospholipid phosphatase